MPQCIDNAAAAVDLGVLTLSSNFVNFYLILVFDVEPHRVLVGRGFVGQAPHRCQLRRCDDLDGSLRSSYCLTEFYRQAVLPADYWQGQLADLL